MVYIETKHTEEEGTCLRCGRELNDHLSLDTMVGPECRKKHWEHETDVEGAILISQGSTYN